MNEITLTPKDIARGLFAAIRGYLERSTAPFVRRIEALELRRAEAVVRDLTTEEKRELAESLKPVLEALHHQWALDWEREATQMMLKAIANVPEPKDGKDGADGLGFEHFDTYLKEDGRTLVLKLSNGEREIVKELRLNIPLYREIYKASETYSRGDAVTYGGSLFIALKDNPGTPGNGADGWRLAVKKGAEGKAK